MSFTTVDVLHTHVECKYAEVRYVSVSVCVRVLFMRPIADLSTSLPLVLYPGFLFFFCPQAEFYEDCYL